MRFVLPMSCALALTLVAGSNRALAMPCDIVNPPDQSLDVPDIAFFDANSDGIDGMACGPIFVDIFGGVDSNLGNMDSPMRTIGAAILAASSFSPPRDVYMSRGTYNETVVLKPGVNVYGGYDAGAGWARSLATPTIIVGDLTAMYAQELPQPVTVDLVTIMSDNAVAFGDDSIGVLVRQAPNGVVFSNCNIESGLGAAGLNGLNGSNGPGGAPGLNGQPGNGDNYNINPLGGSGGAGVSGNNGGKGGNGGSSSTGGPGQAGSPGIGPAGAGGVGGFGR